MWYIKVIWTASQLFASSALACSRGKYGGGNTLFKLSSSSQPLSGLPIASLSIIIRSLSAWPSSVVLENMYLTIGNQPNAAWYNKDAFTLLKTWGRTAWHPDRRWCPCSTSSTMLGILGFQLTWISMEFFMRNSSLDRKANSLNVLPNIYNANGSLAVSLIVGVVSMEIQPGRIVITL